MSAEQLSHAPLTGSYGLVAIAEQAIPVNIERKKRKFLGIFGDIFVRGSTAHNASEAFNLAEVCMDIVAKGKITEKAIAQIPLGDSRRTQETQAQLLTGIAIVHKIEEEKIRRAGGEVKPYQIGLVLADFLEIIPARTAAEILRSSANPQNAEAAKENGRSMGFPDVDAQVIAVEATLLLPANTRGAIFDAMTDLDPKLDGSGYNLFRHIVGAFHDKRSPSYGIGAIYANLSGERAQAKVLEVQSEFSTLGERIRSRFKSSK